jgi:hypothetical protein
MEKSGLEFFQPREKLLKKEMFAFLPNAHII